MEMEKKSFVADMRPPQNRMFPFVEDAMARVVAEHGFGVLADLDVQSLTSYILRGPRTLSAAETVAKLKERGIHVSVSMHPRVTKKKYLRFACYPANSLEETNALLMGFCTCAEEGGR